MTDGSLKARLRSTINRLNYLRQLQIEIQRILSLLVRRADVWRLSMALILLYTTALYKRDRYTPIIYLSLSFVTI